MAGKVESEWAAMAESLKAKTGRSVDEWVSLARTSGIPKHKALVDWLKAEHALTHGYANMIALETFKPDEGPAGTPDDPVQAQYAGDKAALWPVYTALIDAVRGFGSDVEISPKRANVSLRRAKQFGLVQPTTASRLDVGLVLKGVEPTGRLEAGGSFNAMVTHRVRVTGVEGVDSELIAWLRAAYDAA